MDTARGANNPKGRPNYPAQFKHRLATAACEPGVSVSKLAQQHGINANMLFKWRRDLRAGLLTGLKSQSAQLLPVVVQRGPVLPTLRSATSSASFIEIVIAEAVVRVGAGTEAALLQLVLHSLRSSSACQPAPGSGCRRGHRHACRDERPGRQSRDCVGRRSVLRPCVRVPRTAWRHAQGIVVVRRWPMSAGKMPRAWPLRLAAGK